MPNPASQNPADLDRYARQMLFRHVGEAGQRRLHQGRITLIGCGALGTVLANSLARAGVGFLRIVDRDYVELNNLQRQVLFDESDVRDGAPKAVAAARRLATINSAIDIEPVVADANPSNIESFVENADCLLDGTDNFETRFLINDVAVKHDVPWVYGACVAAEGMVMPIVPGETPCLRCIWEQPPPPGMNPTCDTAGVLAPIVNIVASLQVVEALKLLTDQRDALNRCLIQIDAWRGTFERFDLQNARDAGDCPCCKKRRFDYLAGRHAGRSAALCGRDAVQILPPPDSSFDLQRIAAQITGVAKSPPRFNRYLLHFSVGNHEITLFHDGRAIIKGTNDPDEGKSIYARYIGA